ncbi:EH signature domain-containing protein [Corallococcus aberystwythensis]|uniref:Zorya protein ZorC EH domain-containing protein n=1 Tax=Corallococcus aberystwythensis TaxID=2316722 RepID=A0A3A8R0X0_9BACT|nr:EH signature domain-containing protein [Corallococcus aberystwythensis]RKH74676.1 hypothetical protein D7W81_00555 [Corallococcus aberystwythensis]
MGLDDWLDEVGERQKVVLAGLGTFQQQVEEGMRQLVLRVETAQQRADDREPDRLVRMRQTLDVAAVLKKLQERDFSSLTRREQRAVPGLWREVGPERMAWFLDQSPDSLPRLVRQRLRDWSSSEDAASQRVWARLVGQRALEKRALRWALPMSVEDALGANGPLMLAVHWLSHPLGGVVEMLKNAGLKPGAPYAGHVIARHLRQRLNARKDVSEGLKFLVDVPLGRTWLPHNNMDDVAVSAPLESRVAVVSAALECWAHGQVAPDVRGRLEERLIIRDSVFGDPRLTTLTQGWDSVRKVDQAAFDTFLTALIQQDLEFFFERAMHEQDRRKFWLNYLGSIRRTTCWLDSVTYDALKSRLATLPAEQQAAFRRAKRLPRGDVSAFELSFGRHVAVEFSRTGNATYLYEQERDSTQVLRRGAVESARDLKSLGAIRLVHATGWQLRFEQALLELGIAKDRPVKRNAR